MQGKANMNKISSLYRIRRLPPRAGRRRGGHAKHGVVPATGAASVARARQRRPAALAALARARQAPALGQRVQRRPARQAATRLRALPRLQRRRGPPHSAQRRRRLAQDSCVPLPNAIFKYRIVKSVNYSRICSLWARFVDSKLISMNYCCE